MGVDNSIELLYTLYILIQLNRSRRDKTMSNKDFSPVSITESNDVPDSTYFRTGDAEPTFDNEIRTIEILNGNGTSRSWGRPGVTSTVVLETLDLVAIHVGFHHKHGGGQFWRYYQINGDIKQVSWGSLDDDTRSAILEAKRPSWAKAPGKLRSQYKSANPKKNLFTAYKICGINDNGELTSLYDTDIVYEIGRTKVQAARGGYSHWTGETVHGGGWYVHLDAQSTIDLYLAEKLVNRDRMQPRAALVKCECWGNTVEFPSGKIAVTYCKPVELMQEIELELA